MTTTRGYWRRAISGHAGAEPNRALGTVPVLAPVKLARTLAVTGRVMITAGC